MSLEVSHALEKTEQAVSDFGKGIREAFTKQFIDGPSQMLGGHTESPNQQPVGTAEGIGQFVGNAGIYLGANLLAKRIPVLGQLAGGRLATMSVGGLLGFTSPVQNNQGWLERFEKGGLGVATMGGLEFGPGLVSKIGMSGTSFASGLGRSVVSNGLAGLIETTGTTGIDQHRLPTAGELALGTGSWMFTGGVLHGLGARIGTPTDTGLKVAPPEFSPGSMTRVNLADGREYHAYVPLGYDASKPTQAMFVLHGDVFSFQNAKVPMMSVESGMNKVADDRNFLVFYPRAASRAIDKGWLKPFGLRGETWNFRGARNITSTWESYDDLHYLDNVFRDASNRFNLDKSRLSMVGFSDGGRAVQRYAAERPGTLAAIGSVHGTVFGDEPRLGPGLPKPDVLIVHSTPGEGRLARDLMVPWEGGLGPASSFRAWGGTFDGLKWSRPAEQVSLWRTNPNAPEFVTTNGNVTTTVINDDGHVIKQILVKGGQHAWHGEDGKGGLALIGARSKFPNVTKEVADFLLNSQLADGRLNISRSLTAA